MRYGLPERILMTADTMGGVWTYALELVREFAAEGIDVAIATMGAPLSLDQVRQAGRLSNLEVFESDLKLEWMNSPWKEVDDAGDWLLYLEQLLAPDIVHLNGYVHASLPWKVPTLIVAHSCVLSWWQAVKGDLAPQEWDTYRARVTRGLSAANFVVTPSKAMLSAIESTYGELDNTQVIYNGRSSFDFTTGPKENVIFSAGRLWDEAKNIPALAGVAPALSWPVFVAGEQSSTEGMAPGDATFENMQGLGRLSDEELAKWYSRASIYVLPAKYEPFGLSVLEAALSGCALVLGDIPSLREVWGEAAVFVSPSDGVGLAVAINELIRNAGYRTKMGHKARERALEFTSDRMAKGYLGLYEKLLSASMVPAQPHMQEAGVCA